MMLYAAIDSGHGHHNRLIAVSAGKISIVVSRLALRHKGVMWITTEEAVTMYARFCRARFGVRAKDMVLAKADKLEAAGDLEGKRIWGDVARALDKLHDASNEKPTPQRRTKSFN